MKTSNRVIQAAVLGALVLLIALLFWSAPDSARANNANVIVLCSSCVYEGLPREGHLVLLDGDTGEIWMYSDDAMAGMSDPIYWGKLTLGKRVARPSPRE